jgi:hypothetical protein
VDTPGHETLTTGDESAPRVSEVGFAALEAIVSKAEPDIVVLDPLGTFCPSGLNNNGVMSQVLLRLKRLAKTHGCAILVVHHTRKDNDLTNVDAIGGASAIVNQARVALMIARMTSDEAKDFKGILPSDLWRYFRILDAKTNLSPPSSKTQWYQLVSHELPNSEPPTYVQGDGVQVVDKVDPAQLHASPVASITDLLAKHAILQAAHSADPPFSPSSRGGSNRYIVRGVLDAVRQATGMSWADRDLTKHVEGLVREMIGAGWLRVEEFKVDGRKCRGLAVEPARTPWALEFDGASPEIPEIPRNRFRGFEEERTEDIRGAPSRPPRNVLRGMEISGGRISGGEIASADTQGSPSAAVLPEGRGAFDGVPLALPEPPRTPATSVGTGAEADGVAAAGHVIGGDLVHGQAPSTLPEAVNGIRRPLPHSPATSMREDAEADGVADPAGEAPGQSVKGGGQ